MTVFQTIGLFYVVLATGLFTAAWMIAATYAFVVGFKRIREWIAIGREITADINYAKR